MQNHYSEANGLLDRMLINSGNETLKASFLKIAQKSRKQAVALINHNGLRFTTLYILLPEIDGLSLYDDLIPRNQIAFTLCAKILMDLKPSADVNKQLSDNNDFIHSVLKWMFITGAKDDGLSNEFDQVLDVVASRLIRIYHDADILPELVRIIFSRNRKGFYTNDLVWALFGSRNPHIFRLIAKYLRSQRRADVELAGKLLKHAPGEENSDGTEKRPQYSMYLSWFKENQPYLYFTGEGFHQTSDPTPCCVDLGAKFLCKKISPKDRKPIEPLTEADNNHLDEFYRKKSAEEVLLARYSHHLHSVNRKQWDRWMEYPIDKQVKIAKDRLGGAS